MKFRILIPALSFVLITLFLFPHSTKAQQLQISDFALFGGDGQCPSGPGQTPPPNPGCAVVIGAGSQVLNGWVGSYKLVKANGSVSINGEVHSGGKIEFTNATTVTGKMTAANSESLPGTIFNSGSGALFGNNIDVKGNISISGGIVSGKVTHPIGTTYNGPVPAGGESLAPPALPIMPVMPVINVFPAAGITDVTNTGTISPGSYGKLALTGNKTLTFGGPGTYIFSAIDNSGGFNKFVFDFQNSVAGVFNIYVHGDVNLFRLHVDLINGGSAGRIFTETHGKGKTFTDGTIAFRLTSGTLSGRSSEWVGTVWAPYADIKVGSGSGEAKITGALWSATQVDIEHAITVIHVPQDEPCKGQITITKVVSGTVPSTDWQFTSASLGNFTLPAAGGSKTFNGLSPGIYSVSEVSKPNYTASSSCTPGPDNAIINLTGCEHLSCTFTNTYIPPCICIECNGNVITVDQNVTINFNTAIPTYTGDPDLKPFFSYDKSGGITADKWKAIFVLGKNKLVIKNGATLTVSTVSGYAPGIVIKDSCELMVEKGGRILVISQNKNAGNIDIEVHGDISIAGEVRNEVTGTLGLPGAIQIKSKCKNINISGLVQILGIDAGGNTISLITCGDDCFPGDIVISGLVKAYAHAHATPLTLNRPNIRVVSLNGGITINANSLEPLYDEFSVGGGLYDIYGGLLSWVRDNVNPGKVEVQAKGDIIVNGHGTDPTGPFRKTWGAIAAVGTSSNAPGGLVDVRSLEGKIAGNDRAFDVSGRNRLVTNFANIRLWAKKDIELYRLGANNNFNPVVNASGLGAGDKGGFNFIRSFTGGIKIGANAIVTAAVISGTQGTNTLTSCTGVTNAGTVTPPDANPGDDINVCVPNTVEPIYATCVFGPRPGRTVIKDQDISKLFPEKITLLQNYPNPFRSASSIGFLLPSASKVKLSVYDASGRELMILVNELRLAGTHYVDVNAAGLRSGVYYYKLQAGEQSEMRNMLIK